MAGMDDVGDGQGYWTVVSFINRFDTSCIDVRFEFGTDSW